ncbi:MAG: DUF1566 domain-containing protein [Desulfuromonadaceae bacterium]
MFLLLSAPVGDRAAPAAEQVCSTKIMAITPEVSFATHDDGTVTHRATGLVWMRCSLGQTWAGERCNGAAATFTWAEALQGAARQTFAGYSDWRLPNKNELESLLEEGCHTPAINAGLFPETPPDYFWTSSPYAAVAHGAWSVDFGYGSVNASVKSGKLYVRLVRGGR